MRYIYQNFKPMNKIVPLFIILLFGFKVYGQKSPFEISKGIQTTSYQEAISFYQILSKKYPKQAKLLLYGKTDFGKNLHLMVLSRDGDFNPKSIKAKGKRIFLINNGIHPGEPEGIDASMMLARNLLMKNELPNNQVIAIIPIYNIGGSHNRTGTSRANQNGPLAYGFRGNAKNYDLNRDFIKTDSKNSWSFQQLFNLWQPDIFVDTHTSNGADYSYTMTLIPAQKDKLHPILAKYLTEKMLPAIQLGMKQKGIELAPYINSVKSTPDDGIMGFMESPRYSTGYAALHNCIGFMPETHMLKPFNLRVEATYKLLKTYINVIEQDAQQIGVLKAEAENQTSKQNTFVLDWKLDTKKYEEIEFKGYTAKYKQSEVSNELRLYYDRNEPYTKKIKQWNTFVPSIEVQKPYAYYIPQAWTKVIDLLKLNGVKLQQLRNDTLLNMEMYYIEQMKTSSRPYEGHYLHSDVQLKTKNQTLTCYKGDYIAITNQKANRYLIECLEPQAPDSFFAWNFFDSILSMKEHFSPYIFEDTAAKLLQEQTDLKQKLEDEKAKNPQLAQNGYAQLEFIYKNSPYFEETYMRYPIGRIKHSTNLNLQ